MIEAVVLLLKKGAVNLARAVVATLAEEMGADVVNLFAALPDDISADDALEFLRKIYSDDLAASMWVSGAVTMSGGRYPFVKSE